MAENCVKNPDAFCNVLGRMLEAHGRGFWHLDEEKFQELRSLYDVTNKQLEGVTP